MAQLANHVMVAGPSGGGKTTYLREKHAKADGYSAFLTTKKGERKAAKNPPKRLRKSGASYPGDISTVRQWALKQSRDVQIVIDEAHNAPSFQSGQGPISKGMREDRERGVEYVIATQNPQNLNNKADGYGLIQQCRYWIFVGPARDWHVPFFNANNMSDMVEHMPTKNYEYVVIDPTAALSPQEKIVFRGKTDSTFG